MNCLVTGGCGFIGSYLVDKLMKQSHEVTIMDDLSNGEVKNKEIFNRLKILDISQLNEKLDYDWVFHLAAKADVVPSIVNPKKYHETNVVGTLNILEAVRNSNIKKFVYAASSSCYGIPEKYPTDENEYCDPQYPYALTKWMGEHLVMHWGKVYKLPVVSLRLFNVYGVGHKTNGAYGAVMGTFLKQKLEEQPLTIVGDGMQTRDFTNVNDIVDAFILAAESNITNEIFNVGSGSPHTVLYLASLISDNHIFISKRPAEPDQTFSNIEKIKTMLGWQPKIQFVDGVMELLNNIDLYKNSPLWTKEKIEVETEDWFRYLQ